MCSGTRRFIILRGYILQWQCKTYVLVSDALSCFAVTYCSCSAEYVFWYATPYNTSQLHTAVDVKNMCSGTRRLIILRSYILQWQWRICVLPPRYMFKSKPCQRASTFCLLPTRCSSILRLSVLPERQQTYSHYKEPHRRGQRSSSLIMWPTRSFLECTSLPSRWPLFSLYID
jgi:hypothetical protein